MKRRLTLDEHFVLARRLAQLDADVRAILADLEGVPLAFSDSVARIRQAIDATRSFADSILYAQFPGMDIPEIYYGHAGEGRRP